MFPQQRAQLFLKRHLMMMFFLPNDVLLYLLQIRVTDREIRITALPFKISVIRSLLFEPAVGHAFQFLHPFRLGYGPAKTAEQMNVIFHATDDKGRTFQDLRDSAIWEWSLSRTA